MEISIKATGLTIKEKEKEEIKSMGISMREGTHKTKEMGKGD